MTRALPLIWLLCLAAGACAGRRINLPGDPGAPLPDAATIFSGVMTPCSGVRTFTGELALSGRAGDQKLRGRVVAGFARPAAMRLEGVAPFGPPAFILVSQDADATLVLPRDNAVVRNAPPGEILRALTGVDLQPADLQAVLTGCVVPAPRLGEARLHQNGWASIEVDADATVYLQRVNGQWQLRAARRGAWQLEYTPGTSTFPQAVRLRATSGPPVDLAADIRQVETNVDLDAAAFTVNVPPDATSLTLDDLRANGPLRGQ